MSHTFKIGEIAILDAPEDVYDKQDVQVVGGLEIRVGYCRRTGQRNVAPKYRIRTADGHDMQAYPGELRKRRPPHDPAYLKFRDELTRQEKVLERALSVVHKEFSL